jgi:aerobic C4-dicarboxylate transport protein
VVVSHWEKELDHDRLAAELRHPTHTDDDKELYPERKAA